jgi:hypothetical protein
MPVVIFCGWHNTVTGEHAVAGVACTWLILWRDKKELLLVLVLVRRPLSGRLCFWLSIATIIVRRVSKIAKSDYQLRYVCLSAWNISAPTGEILMKFDI